jgi:RNA polymerase sigma-70 factor, ECF subfamily
VTSHNPDNLALAVHMGEPGALEQLVCRYQDGLYGYALRLLGNEFDAQEAVQDALVGAWRALVSRYDESKCRSLALRPWLFRITRNNAFNRRRARKRRVDTEPEADAPSPPEPDVGRDSLLECALSGLGASDRELITLRFYEDLGYAEIARVVSRTESAARGGVFRALRRLRARLNQMGYFNAL